MPYPLLPVLLPVHARKAQVFARSLRKNDRVRFTVFGAFIALLATFTLSRITSSQRSRHDDTFKWEEIKAFEPDPNKDPCVFIAIGSAPQNRHLRDAARETWLKWLPSDGSVSYLFFTDSPANGDISGPGQASWDALLDERATHEDLVLQPLPVGYGTKEHNAYSIRALYQIHHALQFEPALSFFLRIDDDSFLCLHRLVYEVKSLPRKQFFWGKFWCRSGRNRADENFMLFSRDVVRLLADDSLRGRLIPFDDDVTLGWNFGYWSWLLNLTIFDDQDRIDAQQRYLTKYMHGEPPFKDSDFAGFCDKFVYAHHVREDAIRAAFRASKTHLMYSLPTRHGPTDTCKSSDRSLVPRRHSEQLPDVKIMRS